MPKLLLEKCLLPTLTSASLIKACRMLATVRWGPADSGYELVWIHR